MKSVITKAARQYPQTSRARFQPRGVINHPYTTMNVASVLVITVDQNNCPLGMMDQKCPRVREQEYGQVPCYGFLFFIGSKDELDDKIRKTLKEMKVQAYLVPDGEDYSGTIIESVLQS